MRRHLSGGRPNAAKPPIRHEPLDDEVRIHLIVHRPRHALASCNHRQDHPLLQLANRQIRNEPAKRPLTLQLREIIIDPPILILPILIILLRQPQLPEIAPDMLERLLVTHIHAPLIPRRRLPPRPQIIPFLDLKLRRPITPQLRQLSLRMQFAHINPDRATQNRESIRLQRINHLTPPPQPRLRARIDIKRDPPQIQRPAPFHRIDNQIKPRRQIRIFFFSTNVRAELVAIVARRDLDPLAGWCGDLAVADILGPVVKGGAVEFEEGAGFAEFFEFLLFFV